MKIPAILVFVAILLLISLAAIDAFAQNAPPAFDVAVVKLNVSGSGNSSNKPAGDRAARLSRSIGTHVVDMTFRSSS